MKIVAAISCKDKYKECFYKIVNDKAEMVFVQPSEITEEIIADAEVIIGNPPRRMMKAANKLKWLQTVSAGVEGYVQCEDFPTDAVLTNMTGAFGCIIAEYVMAGVLSMYRRLFDYKRQQEQCLWQDAGSELMLMGKQVLILGAGDIGEETAKRMAAFGAHVTGVRRIIRDIPSAFERMATLDQIDELLGEADIVVGCLPHTPETVHILDERRLRLMKKGALFVNVGRGSLVVTEALVKVLEEGHLMGAVLDVMEVEPLPKDHPLWGMNQVLLTPHVSGKSFGHVVQVEEKIIRACCENLERYLEGKMLKNRVDRTYGYADYKYRGGN